MYLVVLMTQIPPVVFEFQLSTHQENTGTHKQSHIEDTSDFPYHQIAKRNEHMYMYIYILVYIELELPTTMKTQAHD